jgi:hypothetical protein
MDVHAYVGDELGIVDEALIQTTSSTSTDDPDLEFIRTTIASIERLEAMARTNAERLRDAIAALEMELPSTEPPATNPMINSENEMHRIELPSVEECEVE